MACMRPWTDALQFHNKLIEHKYKRELENILMGKMNIEQAWSPKFRYPVPIEIPGVTACFYNARNEELRVS